MVRNGNGQISHSLPSLIASYLRLIYAEAIADPLPCAVSRYVRLERDRQSVLLIADVGFQDVQNLIAEFGIVKLYRTHVSKTLILDCQE